MSKTRDVVHFVGGFNYDHYIHNGEDDSVKQELRESIENLCSDSNLNNLYIFPNFQYGYLNNSIGWVAKIPKKKLFIHSDLYNSDKFKVIMAAELNIKELKPERLSKIKNILSKCFPVDVDIPVTIRDTIGSGWHPCLGSRGCSIGIYSTQEEDIKENRSTTRYFVVCHSSLPESTLESMIEHDHQRVLNNRRTVDFYDFVGSKLPASKTKSNSPTYNYNEFSTGSLNDHMRNISVENCRRLIVIFSEMTGLALKYTTNTYSKDETIGTDKIISSTDRYGPGYDYRLLDDSKIFDGGEIDLILKAMKHWVEDVPIYSFSKISNNIDVPKQFRNLPIGQMLASTLPENPENKEHLNLITTPRTTKEDICTEYNTYRIARDSDILWYSNCTPTDTASDGIIRSNGLELGYTVINPSFKESVQVSHFDNGALNAYPVVFPFKRDNHRKIDDSVLEIFYDSYKTKKPRQLLGVSDMGNGVMESSSLKDILYPRNREKILETKLSPVSVLLSRFPVGNEYEYS